MDQELSRRYSQEKNGRPRKALFFSVPDRSRETLIPIIQRFVRPGSMVFTDEYATYMYLRQLGFRHSTVCHKHEFCHFVIEGFESSVSAQTTSSVSGRSSKRPWPT